MLEFYICSLAGIAFLLDLIVISNLGYSVTCPRLSLQQRCFWDRIITFKGIVFISTRHTQLPTHMLHISDGKILMHILLYRNGCFTCRNS